jgi:hypothetical protein
MPPRADLNFQPKYPFSFFKTPGSMEPRPRLQNNALMGYMAKAHDVMHRHRVGILDEVEPINLNHPTTP